MVLLLKNYTYTLPRIQRGPLFPRGGGGSNANFYRNPYKYLLFSKVGCPGHLSPFGSAHGQCHHNGTIFIIVPLLTIIVRHCLSGLMTDEVFQMMQRYCARLTPLRNTALGSGSVCNSAFFLQNIHYLNAVSRKISLTG